MYVCGCVGMLAHYTTDWIDLERGSVVLLHPVLKPVDFEFKRSRVRVRVIMHCTVVPISFSRECLVLPVYSELL